MQPPPAPPASFADFDFTFDTSFLPSADAFGLQAPPPLDGASEMFAPEETTTLLGFLDNFAFDFPMPDATDSASMHDPMAGFRLQPPPPPSNFGEHSSTANPMHLHPNPENDLTNTNGMMPAHQNSQTASSSSDTRKAQPRMSKQTRPSASPDDDDAHDSHEAHSLSQPVASSSSASIAARKKAPVPSSQKRLNHIASEQKRRNMIRDGYANLTKLLAPAGTHIENALPRRGRPRGSGARGRGLGKGKSGVLFRAVEYVAWLQENCDALEEEIARIESVPPSIR